MAKSRRKAPKRVRISASTRDAIVGVSLCFIALVVFFSDASSSVGLFLRPLLESLFGADYRVLFSPVLAVLGTMLVMRRVIWNAVRFLGLLLFWTSVTSLWSFFATALPTGAFDLHRSLSAWFGTVPAVFLLLVVFAASLVLAFEISIRDVFRIAMRRVGEARDYLPTVEPRDERAGKGEEKVTRFDFRMGKDRDPEPKDMRKEAPHEARMRDLEQQIEALKGKSAPKTEKVEKSAKPVEIPEDPTPAKAEVRIPVFSKKKPEMPAPEAADPIGIAGDASETPAGMPDFGTWEFPPADILEASK